MGKIPHTPHCVCGVLVAFGGQWAGFSAMRAK